MHDDSAKLYTKEQTYPNTLNKIKVRLKIQHRRASKLPIMKYVTRKDNNQYLGKTQVSA